jgi:hypothetical protein
MEPAVDKMVIHARAQLLETAAVKIIGGKCCKTVG